MSSLSARLQPADSHGSPRIEERQLSLFDEDPSIGGGLVGDSEIGSQGGAGVGITDNENSIPEDISERTQELMQRCFRNAARAGGLATSAAGVTTDPAGADPYLGINENYADLGGGLYSGADGRLGRGRDLGLAVPKQSPKKATKAINKAYHRKVMQEHREKVVKQRMSR